MSTKSRIVMNKVGNGRVPKTIKDKIFKGDKVQITATGTDGVVTLADNIAARYMVKFEGGKKVYSRTELLLHPNGRRRRNG